MLERLRMGRVGVISRVYRLACARFCVLFATVSALRYARCSHQLLRTAHSDFASFASAADYVRDSPPARMARPKSSCELRVVEELEWQPHTPVAPGETFLRGSAQLPRTFFFTQPQLQCYS